MPLFARPIGTPLPGAPRKAASSPSSGNRHASRRTGGDSCRCDVRTHRPAAIETREQVAAPDAARVAVPELADPIVAWHAQDLEQDLDAAVPAVGQPQPGRAAARHRASRRWPSAGSGRSAVPGPRRGPCGPATSFSQDSCGDCDFLQGEGAVLDHAHPRAEPIAAMVRLPDVDLEHAGESGVKLPDVSGLAVRSGEWTPTALHPRS